MWFKKNTIAIWISWNRNLVSEFFYNSIAIKGAGELAHFDKRMNSQITHVFMSRTKFDLPGISMQHSNN